MSACFRDVCGFVCVSLAPRRFRFRRAVRACLLGPGLGWSPAPLGWVVGVCFLRFFFLFFRLLGVPVPGLVVSPPVSFLSGWAAGCFFFFRGVCLLVSVPLFLVGRCSWLGVAGFGWVVPLCLFGGPVFGALWVGGLATFCVVGGRFGGSGLFSHGLPPPPFFWGGGGAAWLFLPLPSLGWRLLSGCCVVWLVPRHSWRRFLCATPRHSWLGFAAGGGGRSPPLLAGVRWRRWCVVCGVWLWSVGGVVAGVWCGWSLATPGGGSCVLLPATPAWVSLPVVVGGPRHSWLGSVGGIAVWCVVCGGGVLVGLSLVCGVVGPRHSWLVSAGGGGVWCLVCGGGVLVGSWLVCGVVGPSPLLAVVPVCYSPLLLAGFRCRMWWAVPATPGWDPLAAVVFGVWCVVCGGGVLLGLWLVCGVVGPSPLLAEVPVCYSPTLAGVRCRWWWAVPATPGWGPLAALLCGVWRWCVGGVVASVWCGWSPPLLAGVRWRRWCVVCGVWCVVCGGGVLVGTWLVCGVVGPSPLLAEVPVCYSPPLLAGFRCRWWWAVPATPGWGPLAAVVCGVWCGWSLATPG